jgi:hypothetical protein
MKSPGTVGVACEPAQTAAAQQSQGSKEKWRKHRKQVQGAYLTESVCEVVLQKSIPAQIRQPILYVSKNTG